MLNLALVTYFIFGGNAIEPSSFAGDWNCYLVCPGGKIKFGMAVIQNGDGEWAAELTNGAERIVIPHFSVEDETYSIQFDHYDSAITGRLVDGQLTGKWKKRRGSDRWVELDFGAKKTDQQPGSLFGTVVKENPFHGRWSVDFGKSDDPAVGVFEPGSNGHLRGTFLTTTGDYRYLFGTASENHMELSCFDGAHAFLFRGKMLDHKIVGEFWSSDTWHETWNAVKDKNAQLPDAFNQTVWSEQDSIGNYSFKNLDGLMTSLAATEFEAPVKLVYVFGSWCPNCHDAAAYFKELQEKFGTKLKIVGVAFEHTGDFDRDVLQVRKYLKRNNVEYPVLMGGLSDKSKASQAVGFIDRVRSYPTTIFVDANQKIRAVHTGFTGPATGNAYTKMKSRFETLIDRISSE